MDGASHQVPAVPKPALDVAAERFEARLAFLVKGLLGERPAPAPSGRGRFEQGLHGPAGGFVLEGAEHGRWAVGAGAVDVRHDGHEVGPLLDVMGQGLRPAGALEDETFRNVVPVGDRHGEAQRRTRGGDMRAQNVEQVEVLVRETDVCVPGIGSRVPDTAATPRTPRATGGVRLDVELHAGETGEPYRVEPSEVDRVLASTVPWERSRPGVLKPARWHGIDSDPPSPRAGQERAHRSEVPLIRIDGHVEPTHAASFTEVEQLALLVPFRAARLVVTVDEAQPFAPDVQPAARGRAGRERSQRRNPDGERGAAAVQTPNDSGFQARPSSPGGAMYPTSADAATTDGLAR